MSHDDTPLSQTNITVKIPKDPDGRFPHPLELQMLSMFLLVLKTLVKGEPKYYSCFKSLRPTHLSASSEWRPSYGGGGCDVQQFHFAASEASMIDKEADGKEGWCHTGSGSTSSASVNEWRPYLQVDIGEDVIISGVAAQKVNYKFKTNCQTRCHGTGDDHRCETKYHGNGNTLYCAKKFYLAYRTSYEQAFKAVKLRGAQTPQVFTTCNSNKQIVKQTLLEEPIMARWIRFIPIEGSCLRVKVYGCSLQQQSIRMCSSREKDGGGCCASPFDYSSKTFTSCHRFDNFNRLWCSLTNPYQDGQSRNCKINNMPDIGTAVPIGMKSGMILSSQFEVPSNEDKSQYARLYGLNERWYPNSTSLIPGFTIDLANLQNAPVYFQINFLRPKKLSYVIIQGWESAELFSQRFYLSYTNMKGVEAHYGETTPKEISCENSFGDKLADCRHLITQPFRAKSVRLIAKDWIADKSALKLEYGGHDYLDADHNWRMDTLQKYTVGDTEHYIKFVDERGPMNLLSNRGFPDDSSTIYDGSFRRSSAKEYSWTYGSLHNDCFGNPDKCNEGFSVSFWFKVQNCFYCWYLPCDLKHSTVAYPCPMLAIWK